MTSKNDMNGAILPGSGNTPVDPPGSAYAPQSMPPPIVADNALQPPKKKSASTPQTTSNQVVGPAFGVSETDEFNRQWHQDSRLRCGLISTILHTLAFIILALLTYGEGFHNYHHIFQTDYRNGVRWYQWDPTKWMIRLCSWLGLASHLKRVPDFKIQRALLGMQLKRAQEKLDSKAAAAPLRAKLEQELHLFSESVARWKELQSQRYERKVGELEGAFAEQKRALQSKWENAAVRTHLKELEYSLKMQRKRVELLMLQVQAA